MECWKGCHGDSIFLRFWISKTVPQLNVSGTQQQSKKKMLQDSAWFFTLPYISYMFDIFWKAIDLELYLFNLFCFYDLYYAYGFIATKITYIHKEKS
jgi:hypothetical protein